MDDATQKLVDNVMAYAQREGLTERGIAQAAVRMTREAVRPNLREALIEFFHDRYSESGGCVHGATLRVCVGWADALLASGVLGQPQPDRARLIASLPNLEDLYWKTTGDDWAIPVEVMEKYALAVIDALLPLLGQPRTDDVPSAALEAAQRPPVSTLDYEELADWLGEQPEAFNVRDYTDEYTTAIEIGVETLAERIMQRWAIPARPPVSPEQREALAGVVTSAMIRAKTDTPYGVTDAILAGFSLPVLDVEKVAEAIARRIGWRSLHWEIDSPELPRALAEAVVAALTTGGAPSDTERNES